MQSKEVDLESWGTTQLRKMARVLKIQGRSKLNRQELIDAIRERMQELQQQQALQSQLPFRGPVRDP